jgi:hypothetical protein
VFGVPLNKYQKKKKFDFNRIEKLTFFSFRIVAREHVEVPKLVTHAVDWIIKYGKATEKEKQFKMTHFTAALNTEGIFRIGGNRDQLEALKRSIDQGSLIFFSLLFSLIRGIVGDEIDFEKRGFKPTDAHQVTGKCQKKRNRKVKEKLK